ncbi:MAG: glycosyltransferase [Cytophagales bacterium]|nr:glycosyltransferase [Cytophagales bacterium]MDW8384427.1 glycosyltransferase [Flammeovirgaceae bacterium]
MKKLSVALTTYNHEKYIAAALESIFAQNLQVPFEIVIGNDCSTDKTGQIIEAYQQKYPDIIRNLPRNSNLGYVRNFDETMQACQGEYIAIFDGDDIMLPGKLNKQIEMLDRHPEYVMVGHNARAFDSETGKTIRYIKPRFKKPEYTIEDLIVESSFFANSSKVFRKSAYPKEGIDRNLYAIADWYITIEIAKKGKIGYIHENLVEYRVHNQSIMQKIRGDKQAHDILYILDKLEKEFPGKYTHLFARQKAYCYLILGIQADQENNKQLARKNFAECIKLYPRYSVSPYIRWLLTFAPKSLFHFLLKQTGRTH